jgi:hypothetical protein
MVRRTHRSLFLFLSSSPLPHLHPAAKFNGHATARKKNEVRQEQFEAWPDHSSLQQGAPAVQPKRGNRVRWRGGQLKYVC